MAPDPLTKDVSHQVAESLTRYNMLSHGDRVGVAVSGGADSIVLLHILHRLAQYQITVLHVNHHLRGEESAEDERFVSGVAGHLGLPIEVHHAPLSAGNMEQMARDGRREFFFAVAQRLALRRIVLGHNQSDQAETVLYRFLRGSGLSGLAGMRPVSGVLIRPMMTVTREEIRAWATAEGIIWREDSSNENTELVRNRMRLEVFNPKLVQILSANASVAQDEEDWWSSRTEAVYAELAEKTSLGIQLPVARMHGLHPAEQRRLLRRALRELKGDLRAIDLSHIEAIRKLLTSEAGHDRVLLPGADTLRSFGTLLLAIPGRLGSEPRHYRMFSEIGKELALPYAAGRLYVNWVKPEEPFCGNFGVEALSAEEVMDLDGDVLRRVGDPAGLNIRNWEPGDEYRRAGHEKSEKIKSLFQEYRVVLWDRRRWPVMVLDDEIVWSRLFGVAAKFQAHEGSGSILRCMYRPG